MISIMVVEPYALIRLGIQQLLHKMTDDITSEGIDYHQLFQNSAKNHPINLMLLSVPDTYERAVELVNAAETRYAPQRILLLSETQTLPYSLLNMPASLVGYISKNSCHDVLASAVTLVLVGGKCFPSPDNSRQDEISDGRASATDKHPNGRRWYDRAQPIPVTPADEIRSENLLPATMPAYPPPARPSAAFPTQPMPQLREGQEPEPIPADLVNKETRLLNLTPRQYEVLVLLAQGQPLKKVSRKLDISLATAKTHTEAIYQRLSVNNRNAAVYAALSRGATLGWYLGEKDPGKLKGSQARYQWL
jgi:DNA-binding NarL/FixJ family response regulator